METVTTFTDAPPDFDGFGTFTARVVGRSRCGDVREVVTPAEHADWQRSRYLSGPYLVCHDEARLRQIAPTLGVELLPPGESAARAVRAALDRLVTESSEGVFDPSAGAWRQAVAALKQPDAPAAPRPTVVCLCGSTRFADAWRDANRTETLAGRIVLSVGLLGHSEGIDMGGPVKAALDELHLRKIDLADEILVLNVGGYVGDSTRREVAYALAHGKPVRYLESKEVPS